MSIHKALLFFTLLFLTPVVAADLVLVVNSESGIERLSQREVVNIYLGRYRRLSTGATAAPIDLSVSTESKAVFYRQLVDKNLAEIDAYWSRLVFSGKTRPPQQVENVDEALEFLANNLNALAYIDRAAVNSQVTIVFEWLEQ